MNQPELKQLRFVFQIELLFRALNVARVQSGKKNVYNHSGKLIMQQDFILEEYLHGML